MGETLLVILGSILIAASLFLLVRPYLPGAILAYVGMWVFNQSYLVTFSARFFISWGIITAITVGLDLLQGKKPWQPVDATIYMLVGAIIGWLLGLLIGEYWLIPGCALGTLMATYAYSRTPAGKNILFSSSTLIQYFCEYGLRVIVTVIMVGYVIGSLLSRYIALDAIHAN